RQASPLSQAIAALGFNAVSLLKDIGGNGSFAGRPVDSETIVRDMDLEDWARIVDVFYQWPFKPDVSEFLLPILYYTDGTLRTYS
nr:hypothetical protein [Tanacetum cinerariifolium]